MIKSLVFLFVFALLQIRSVEAAVKFEFERREAPVTNSTRRLEATNETDTHEKCPPGQYVKVEKAFKQALKTLEPDLPVADVDSWAAPRIAEIEELEDEVCHHGHGLQLTLTWLALIDWETIWESIDWDNIDWDEFNWGVDALSNGCSTHSMKCIHHSDWTQRERALTVATPEEEAQHERHLQMCPGWCYDQDCVVCYSGCWDCFRRRQLEEAEVELELSQMQNAVDAMYNFCLADEITCIDCSTAKLCTDAAVDPNGDPICVGPSCLENDSCESGLEIE